MPTLVKCAWCGKEFLSPIRKGKTAKYCSQPCYWNAWKGDHPELYRLENRICEECGKEYHPRGKDHPKRFCSRECLFAWRARQRKVSCIVCGKEFKRDNDGERFCSQECFHKWNRGENSSMFGVRGEEHPAWQGGIGNLPYPYGFNDELKERIRERDNHQCQLCGVSQAECVRELDIHHIDYDKDNLADENLITLCNPCNIKANFNRGYWQRYFEKRIKELETS